MSSDLLSGRWHEVASEDEFNNLLTYATTHPDERDKCDRGVVSKGTYDGPGKYLVMSYSQPCPKGCCHDWGYQALSQLDVRIEAREQVDKWLLLYAMAGGYHTDPFSE
jgi:hypothetical protein